MTFHLVSKRSASAIVRSAPDSFNEEKMLVQPSPIPGDYTIGHFNAPSRTEEPQLVSGGGVEGAGNAKIRPREGFRIPPDARAVSELANQGTASALAAFETFAWAVMNRETELSAGLIRFSWWKTDSSATVDDAAKWVAHWIKVMPEPLRSEVRTPQRLVALMHENELADYVAYSMAGREVLSAQTEIIRVNWYSADGGSTEEQFLMRSTPNGWVRETHPFLVARIARHYSGMP